MMWQVPLSEIRFGIEEQTAVQRVLQSGWISMGPETERFEDEFRTYVGSAHAAAVSSGTAALHLALLALGVGAGDEVIVPSFTFVATVNAVKYVNAVPVFADITDATDWNIDPGSVAERITERTRAIIAVHYGGYSCRMDALRSLADRHGLFLIEDAAHAPGAAFQGKKLGTWGNVGCFSFFANKNMTCAEGGMIVTDDPDAASRARLLRSHGMTSLTWDRHRGHASSYDVVATGFNYRMDEIRAALGRVQLARLDEMTGLRRTLTRRMREALAGTDGFTMPFGGCPLDSSACHLFPVLPDDSAMRPALMGFLKERGIQTSIHYPPVHRFSVFAGTAAPPLPHTEYVGDRVVTLPLFPTMTEEQVDGVVSSVARAFDQVG